MPTSQKQRLKDGLIQNPGQLGNALANVLSVEGGREVVLGQAWIAAAGRLITCGHVVERFARTPNQLFVRFPASGNKYQVTRVTLHPSYVRQPDQLVKFDVALLEANLQPPESNANPLPFSYEQEITTNQTFWAIRYPAHLGHLSAMPQPLTQEGRYLGPLRIHDTFHLLHDLPLSPGDSGAPITDGNTIVALHCGDTATLPGLNLPTTSIRLALWIDALRELGIAETAASSNKSKGGSLIPAILAFFVSAVVVGGGAYFMIAEQAKKAWTYSMPKLMPIQVSLNKPLDGYKLKDDVVITITPSADYRLHLLEVEDSDDSVVLLYPQYGQDSFVHKGEPMLINAIGATRLTATPSKCMWYLVGIRGGSNASVELDSKVVLDTDRSAHPVEGTPFLIKGKDLVERLKALQATNPDDVLMVHFPGVHSN